MLKRIRWLMLGYLAGLLTSIIVQARIRRAVHRYVPPQVRARTQDQIAAWRHDMRAAWSEGRAASSERERELREQWGIDSASRAAAS